MVDSESMTIRAQQALIKILPKQYINGYYWVVGNNIPKIKSKIFSFQKEHILKISNRVLELIMTAPTPPVKTIQNGRPILEKASLHELRRIKIYPHLSNGAVAFTKDYIQCFDKLKGFFSCDMLIGWINTFCFTPTEMDKTMFLKILDANDTVDHKDYVPIFPDWYH